jgi:alpha-L-fucosidase
MGSLKLANMADKIKYVQFLHDASEIRFGVSDESKNDLILVLPVLKPQVEIPVLEIFLK